MLSVRCAGCGEKVRFGLRAWLMLRGRDTWPHLACWNDYVDQCRLDGIEP